MATDFSRWLDVELADLPPNINLLYLEWNICFEPGRFAPHEGYQGGCLFGYALPDPGEFDPEDQLFTELLSDWTWEAQTSFRFGPSDLAEEEIEAAIRTGVSASVLAKKLRRTRGLVFSFGPHEGDVFLAGANPAKKSKASMKQFFYEAHFGRAGSIEKFELGDFDETPLLEHDKVTPAWPTEGMKLWLEKRARLTDLLRFYRGWIVCSQRLTDILVKYTSVVQVFPAPLFSNPKDGEKPIAGYSVVNVYEKLDCLHEADVRPPSWKGGPRNFDQSIGYRIDAAAVVDKHIFRINYEYFRLLVSQTVRDEMEKNKITGVSWLRRAAIHLEH